MSRGDVLVRYIRHNVFRDEVSDNRISNTLEKKTGAGGSTAAKFGRERQLLLSDHEYAL
jgi:hypothetical protein